MSAAPDRQSLASILAAALPNPPTYSLSRVPRQPVHIEKAGAALIERFGDMEPRRPKPHDLRDIYSRLRTAWEARDLSSVSRRDLRMAPWVFFYPENSPGDWLGAQMEFVRTYQRVTEGGRNSRPSAALLREFLRAGKPEHPSFESIRILLRSRLKDSTSTSITRWRERCERFGYLLPENESHLVNKWQASGLPVDDFLAEAGLSPGLERSELVYRAIELILDQTHGGLKKGEVNEETLKRSLQWAQTGNELRVNRLRLKIAHAFLEPFVDSRPLSEIGTLLRSFFLTCFGDPRLVGTAGWARVPEPQRQVLMRLLVELALKDFFALLDKTALDKHWLYRKRFWTAYLDKGVIDDAWIVLGREARSMAQRRLGADTVLSTAQLEGAGVEPNHSVLLMRIGSITVAEWSHNGKCRFWLGSNPRAPKLYQRKYEGPQLRAKANLAVVHAGSENGTWQKKIASWVSEKTGLYVYRHEYMPAGSRSRRWRN